MKQIKYDRKYLGVTVTSENYRDIVGAKGQETEEGRRDRRFHDKHLRAYLKGRESFFHGWEVDEEGRKIRPIEHIVQQEISVTYLNDKNESVYTQFGSQRQMERYLKNKFGNTK